MDRADETGENVNGKLYWTQIWQTDKLTHTHQDNSKEKAAILRISRRTSPNSTLLKNRHNLDFTVYQKPSNMSDPYIA